MTLLAGSAHVDITPPLGTPLVGYWYLRRASGLLDPLHLRALVLSTGDAAAAIVAADLCYLSAGWLQEPLDEIERQAGIPRECVLVAASHTHTGPVTDRPFTRRHDPLPWYREFFSRRLVDVVRLARQNLTPARLAVGEGRAEGLAFNRRLLGPDGQVHTYKPDTQVQGLEPAGPVDHQVRVLYVQSEAGQPLAAVVNFGLHPDTTGGALISADYPGVLAGTLGRMLGGCPEVLFLNGPCGDINHLDRDHPREPYARANALRIGQTLAAEAYKATREPEWLDVRHIQGRREPVTLHVRKPEPARVEEARRLIEAHTGEPTKALSRAQGLLQVAEHAGEAFTAEVSAISLGETVLVGLPGEIFTAWGLEIRDESPFPRTVIAELANGYVGYVPTEEAFGQGGYEVVPSHGSFVEEAAGRKLTQAAHRLVAHLWEGRGEEHDE